MQRSSLNLLRFVFPVCAATIGCADNELAAPAGVECGDVIAGGDDASALSTALAQATSGDCVLAAASRYQGSFSVPAGVRLIGAEGKTVTLVGEGDAAVVTMASASGSMLRGLSIEGGAIGIVVEGSEGTIENV